MNIVETITFSTHYKELKTSLLARMLNFSLYGLLAEKTASWVNKVIVVSNSTLIFLPPWILWLIGDSVAMKTQINHNYSYFNLHWLLMLFMETVSIFNESVMIWSHFEVIPESQINHEVNQSQNFLPHSIKNTQSKAETKPN